VVLSLKAMMLYLEWTKHKGLMDHAKKVVKLTTDDRRRLEYVVETITSYS
jgi:hypothetical protein